MRGETWIKYCTHSGPSALISPIILTLHTGNYWGPWGHSQFSCWNIGTEKDIISLEQIMCRGNENIIGQNYKARLECGVEIISLKFTWPLLLPLNWTKINQSTASRHINHPNLTLIKTIWSQPSLKLSRLDKINLDLTHSCNCCVVFSHLELSVINAFVMTKDLDTHKPLTTCTPHSSCMGVPTLTSKFLNGY